MAGGGRREVEGDMEESEAKGRRQTHESDATTLSNSREEEEQEARDDMKSK